jgi:hypothetical protein
MAEGKGYKGRRAMLRRGEERVSILMSDSEITEYKGRHTDKDAFLFYFHH